MSLVVVNPRPPHPAKKAKTAPKAKKGSTMAKKRRSPAQRAATARMLAANGRHKTRRRRNPAPIHHRRATAHRRIRRNPRVMRHYRRRRNPSTDTGLFSFMVSKNGLMMAAAVATTPTAMALAQEYIAPSATGYYSAAIQGAIGLAAAWLTYKYVSKEVGQMVGLVAVGTAVAQAVQSMEAGTASVAGYSNNGGKTLTMRGNDGLLNGYSNPMAGRMGALSHEPNMRFL